MADDPALPHTRAGLTRDLARLGVAPGDMLMVHAALSRLGPVLGGPDAVIAGLLDVVGPAGTVAVYTDWGVDYDRFLDADGRVRAEWRAHLPVFDAGASRAMRDHGAIAEFLRTTPGALRSGNPGASVAALGARADWLTRDHPLDYGYGAGSPFARLVEAGGHVLMLGAPDDSMTLLHHAEHLARLPDKRIRRYEVPFATAEGVRWRMIEEFDTRDPVAPCLPADAFARIVAAFRATGAARAGRAGDAPALLVEARAICRFAVEWMEAQAALLAAAQGLQADRRPEGDPP